MGPFKDEHILLIAPGSHVTQAQLGLPESFTPAKFRLASRMYPTEKGGQWEPYKVRPKLITVKRRVPKPASPEKDDAPEAVEVPEEPEKPEEAPNAEQQPTAQDTAGQTQDDGDQKMEDVAEVTEKKEVEGEKQQVEQTEKPQEPSENEQQQQQQQTGDKAEPPQESEKKGGDGDIEMKDADDVRAEDKQEEDQKEEKTEKAGEETQQQEPEEKKDQDGEQQHAETSDKQTEQKQDGEKEKEQQKNQQPQQQEEEKQGEQQEQQPVPEQEGKQEEQRDQQAADKPEQQQEQQTETEQPQQTQEKKDDEPQAEQQAQQQEVKEEQQQDEQQGKQQEDKKNGQEQPQDAQTENKEEKPEQPASAEESAKEATPPREPTPAPKEEPQYIEVEEQKLVYEEDPTSEEGAIFPLRNGAIENWTCFLALLTHVHKTLSPSYQAPILMIAQPCWTTRDREVITQFVFEKLKAPAFCMIDSALAVCYAYGVSTATVIDVGHGKVDVTAVTDFVVQDYGRGIALEKCGGEAMTERLFELLQSKGFSRKMCDQLKRSSICEVLSEETPMPGQETASLSPAGEKESPKPGEGAEKPKQGGEDDDEGVLDVAAIVTGNTTEILAQKEREKAEALAAKKGAAAEAMAKTMRLPNSKRETNFFTFQEYISEKDESGIDVFTLHSKEVEVGQERFMALTPSESKDPERLMFGILETIAAQVHRTISCVPDMSKRGELWDSFIIVGNGSRIKGFNQALISTLTQKYLLTPSTGTIFTNDVPTQFPTPAGTVGTNTPANVNTPNPYLVAATSSANNPTTITVNPNDPNQARGSHPSQTPLSIKAVKAPEYFPEFKVGAAASAGLAGAGAANVPAPTGAAAATNAAPANAPGAAGSVASQAAGFEEAVFLGAQVAAKLVFMIDQGVSKGFLNRDDYNELGPSAIHDCTL